MFGGRGFALREIPLFAVCISVARNDLFSSDGYFAHLPRIQGYINLSQTIYAFSDSRFEAIYLKKLTVSQSPQKMCKNYI